MTHLSLGALSRGKPVDHGVPRRGMEGGPWERTGAHESIETHLGRKPR
jgi:hypothetical protein